MTYSKNHIGELINKLERVVDDREKPSTRAACFNDVYRFLLSIEKEAPEIDSRFRVYINKIGELVTMPLSDGTKYTGLIQGVSSTSIYIGGPIGEISFDEFEANAEWGDE